MAQITETTDTQAEWQTGTLDGVEATASGDLVLISTAIEDNDYSSDPVLTGSSGAAYANYSESAGRIDFRFDRDSSVRADRTQYRRRQPSVLLSLI